MLFSRCKSLEAIILPTNLTAINDELFYRCESLTSVTIPDSVTEINWNSFRWCKSLIEIKIPERVCHVDKWAFSECKSLKKIYYRLGSGLVKNLRVGNNAEIIPYKREQFVETLSEDTSTEDNVWREAKNIQWLISKDTLTINGTGYMDKRLYYEGERGYPWRHSDLLKKVIVEEGITSISCGAFEFCKTFDKVGDRKI